MHEVIEYKRSPFQKYLVFHLNFRSESVTVKSEECNTKKKANIIQKYSVRHFQHHIMHNSMDDVKIKLKRNEENEKAKKKKG